MAFAAHAGLLCLSALSQPGCTRLSIIKMTFPVTAGHVGENIFVAHFLYKLVNHVPFKDLR